MTTNPWEGMPMFSGWDADEEWEEDGKLRIVELVTLLEEDARRGAAEVTLALVRRCLYGDSVPGPHSLDLLEDVVLPHSDQLLRLTVWVAEHVQELGHGDNLWGLLSHRGVVVAMPGSEEVPDDISHLADVIAGHPDMATAVRLRAARQVLDMHGGSATSEVKRLLADLEFDRVWGAHVEDDGDITLPESDLRALARWVAADDLRPIKVRIDAAMWLFESGYEDSEGTLADLLSVTESGSRDRWRLLEVLHSEERGRQEGWGARDNEIRHARLMRGVGQSVGHMLGVVRDVCPVEPGCSLIHRLVTDSIQWRWKDEVGGADTISHHQALELWQFPGAYRTLREQLGQQLNGMARSYWLPFIVGTGTSPYEGYLLDPPNPTIDNYGCHIFRGHTGKLLALSLQHGVLGDDPEHWKLRISESAGKALTFCGLRRGSGETVDFPDELKADFALAGAVLAGLEALDSALEARSSGGSSRP
ncbi:hypothetical protein OG898_04910 [Streptomyces sp. NBC_00193]|uniref:hypothetical protein n=1 Tax=Streptomyces sp. NBC_00193 TaxID=2975675 RepID=UPI002256F4E3|nr:hypothetical protein [Streptomyces sp. NBC_00193]MCX5295828.1 hypothetical protein [Streptomyces sp. NBC_00193]